MKIGLISDTHGHLDPGVYTAFAQCDQIWHAGDIGTLPLLDELSSFKTMRAVYGNIDGHEVRTVTSEIQLFTESGVKVLMIHIAGKCPVYNPQVRRILQIEKPKLLICGHSHILQVIPDKKNNLLFLNPGAAGKHGFHKMKTLLRFELKEGKILNMEAIELGPRARIT